MKHVVIGLIAFFLFIVVAQSLDARGWNDKIQWHTYEEGLELSAQTGKPMLIVLHKTWCGACKRLKPDFAQTKEIEDLSSKFIMVNAEDDEAPHSEKKFQVDWAYIPRIYIADSQGEPLPYSNFARKDYKYFFSTGREVAGLMRQVISDRKL